MKKWQLGLASSTLAILFLVGCGSNSSDNTSGAISGDDKTYTIGVTQIVEHPSLDAAYKGFQKALEEEGVNVTYKEENAQGDLNNSQTIAHEFSW